VDEKSVPALLSVFGPVRVDYWCIHVLRDAVIKTAFPNPDSHLHQLEVSSLHRDDS
jgi:hypothetical protein